MSIVNEFLYKEGIWKWQNNKENNKSGHTGVPADKTWNTLEAFELAVRQGADGIELDVHTSADGELIVMHDENVDEYYRQGGLIKDMTLAQLKELKVNTPTRTIGNLSHSTLAEVLEAHAHHRYDDKHWTKEQHLLLSGNGRKILKLVKEMNMEDQLIYSSFNHYSLLQLKQLNDHVQTGILFSRRMGKSSCVRQKSRIQRHAPCSLSPSTQFIEEVKRAGLEKCGLGLPTNQNTSSW